MTNKHHKQLDKGKSLHWILGRWKSVGSDAPDNEYSNVGSSFYPVEHRCEFRGCKTDRMSSTQVSFIASIMHSMWFRKKQRCYLPGSNHQTNVEGLHNHIPGSAANLHPGGDIPSVDSRRVTSTQSVQMGSLGFNRKTLYVPGKLMV